MTHSCSLSSARLLAAAAVCAAALATIPTLVCGLKPIAVLLTLGALAVAATLAALSWRRLRRIEHALVHALDVCNRAALGDFDHRIIGIDDRGIVGNLIRRTNDAFDLADGFLREARAAMVSAADKRYFRTVAVRGLKGSYRGVAESINDSLATMAATDHSLSQIYRDLEGLVAAATRGDLSRRIEAGGGPDAMTRLCSAINQLVQSTATAIHVIETVLSEIAAGNLEHRVSVNLEGVFGTMGNSTNAMAQRLADVIGDIDTALSQITLVTGEVAMGSRDLLTSTEQQADLLTRTLGNMSQVNAKVVENTSVAEEGNRLAEEARILAARSGQVTRDAATAIRRIADSSRRVSEVVTAIDDIAFQTNILALNASVEAARVGDVGRGFAVVAGEVRDLARRAAESNREIRTMMIESADHVASGVELVLAANHALDDLVQAIGVLGHKTEIIVRTSREQSTDLAEIAAVIESMEEMVTTNASLAKHSAGAAQAVEERVLQLGTLLSYFQSNQPTSS